MRYLFEAVMTTTCLLALIGLIWSMVHTAVAHECDKLGAFYVGDQVYECKRKEGANHDNS